jgi:hypothetical protein
VGEAGGGRGEAVRKSQEIQLREGEDDGKVRKERWALFGCLSRFCAPRF